MTDFNLTTTWRIPASIEACWFSILDVEAWPDWWQYVNHVTEISAGDSHGVDYVHLYDWRTCLPYHLKFQLRTTKIIPYRLIIFEAQGDLNGFGSCRFKRIKNRIIIQFKWHVYTTKPWMTLVASIAQPVFKWNHKQVMNSGERSLIKRLTLD